MKGFGSIVLAWFGSFTQVGLNTQYTSLSVDNQTIIIKNRYSAR